MARIVRVVKKKAEYKSVRMPVNAYNDFMKRKDKMEQIAQNLTNQKIKRVPLTRVFKISAEYPIQLADQELIKLLKKRRG